MILDHAHQALGWPEPNEVFVPKGTATRLTAELADQKIGRALSALSGDTSIRVGVLASNPDSTEAPLALVCQFSRPASTEVLLEAQRLAWNFSRSLLLITVEPTLIRKWSCYEQPTKIDQTSLIEDLDNKKTAQILPALEFDPQSGAFRNEEDAFSLSWIDLFSGAFFAREAKRFKVEERADRLLLDNLKTVRQHLRGLKLEDEFSHDLLARIIFVQFLFDRKDSSQQAALNPEKLAQLQSNGVLKGQYETLAQLLESYEDSYALFRWLNERFNGDLFPGKGDTLEEREHGWKIEQENVKPSHLKKLAEFVRGDLEIKKGQYCLWPQYAFDAIPLELISSIYEEFVTDAQSAHYTPGHLVDLMLDRVLPWESTNWNLKVLDPACGSGIFLVKTFQRLVHRWKEAHRQEDGTQSEITPSILRQLLEKNLFGVDNHRNAIRVASFSLYLAMCDEIDPRHYWSDKAHVNFPPLRDQTLMCRDFFAEDAIGFRTHEDKESYDLVIGNPPWGDASVNEAAKDWAKEHDWQIANKDFGVLFAAKGMALTKLGGSVCMVQSAGALLYNYAGKARDLQTRVFNGWKKIECVVNLAAFRPFKKVKVPTCVLVASHQEPDGSSFWYECPKPFYTPEDKGRITVDLGEMHSVHPNDLQKEPWIWSVLMWGGARDRALLRKTRLLTSVEQLDRTGRADVREGVNRGKPCKPNNALLGWPILQEEDFPGGQTLNLDIEALDINQNPDVHRVFRNLNAFALPQLLLKASWLKKKKRFQSRLVKSSHPTRGALCSQSYVSVHAPVERHEVLDAACLAYNSNWANYFLLLTSGRFAFDRSEPLGTDLKSLPLPLLGPNDTLPPSSASEFRALLETDSNGEPVTLEAIDNAVFRAFEFQDAERILIEDLVESTLADFKWRDKSPSRRPTHRKSEQDGPDEPDLRRYCETLLQVLTRTYGADKAIAARIWSETNTQEKSRLPMRYVSIIFGDASQRGIQIHSLENRGLRERITALHRKTEEMREDEGFSRQVRSYETITDEETGEKILVLQLLKPDWLRNWTRSVALRDADEIARDFWTWQVGSQPATAKDEGDEPRQNQGS